MLSWFAVQPFAGDTVLLGVPPVASHPGIVRGVVVGPTVAGVVVPATVRGVVVAPQVAGVVAV